MNVNEYGGMTTERVKETRTLEEAIHKYGNEAQTKMLLEEMAELQKEICKFWRGKDNLEDIADEVADVEIMLAQTKMIFGIEEAVTRHRTAKLQRLSDRMKGRQT